MSTKKKTPEVKGKEIGTFLLACRTSKGMSQREYANQLGEGTSGPYLALVENGRVRYPVEVCARLPKAEREVALEILSKYLKEDLGL